MKGLPPWALAVSFAACAFLPLAVVLSLYRQLERAWVNTNQGRTA